jgi:hypothetical protein
MVKLCCNADGRGRRERDRERERGGGRKSVFKKTHYLIRFLGITHVVTNHPKMYVQLEDFVQ